MDMSSDLALERLCALVDDGDVPVEGGARGRLVAALLALVRLLLHVHRDHVLLHVRLLTEPIGKFIYFDSHRKDCEFPKADQHQRGLHKDQS